jgi:hypothetical protein
MPFNLAGKINFEPIIEERKLMPRRFINSTTLIKKKRSIVWAEDNSFDDFLIFYCLWAQKNNSNIFWTKSKFIFIEK